MAVLGCVPDEGAAPSTGTGDSEVVRTVTGSPVEAIPYASRVVLEGGEPITALGETEGFLFIGTGSGAYGVHGDMLTALEARDGGGALLDTGPVLHIAPWRDRALVVSTEGFFIAEPLGVVRSPLSDDLESDRVDALHVWSEGEGEVLWLAMREGLQRVGNGRIVGVDLPADAGAVVGLGQLDRGLFVAHADRVSRVDLDTWEVRTWAVRFGAIHDLLIDPDASTVWVGTDLGAFALRPNQSWTRYALAEQAADAATVWSLSLSSPGEVVCGTDRGIIRIRDHVATLFVDGAQASSTLLFVDRHGDVWHGDASKLSVLVPEGTGFAEHVAPLLDRACQACHADGSLAPRRDFGDYDEVLALADAILQRVLTGQMPPGAPLPERDLELLTRWDAEGRQP